MDALKKKQIRILQRKLQLGILVAMNDKHQNIPYKKRDMILTEFKKLSIGTSTKDPPTA